LTRELEVIRKWSLAPYFLLVLDIVEEARRRRIPAVARGSAASSIVTYCLGISCVCPLRWGLYFERFLNEQRGDCPDIDIDICGARRDELLDYVYEHWGAEHVAMIGSFITMHARARRARSGKKRSACRRVMWTDSRSGCRTGRCVKFYRRFTAWRNAATFRERRALENDPASGVAARRRATASRDSSLRHGDSARPLNRLTPLERATKGIVVTQYDMNAVEALGLIKMDLLGSAASPPCRWHWTTSGTPSAAMGKAIARVLFDGRGMR